MSEYQLTLCMVVVVGIMWMVSMMNNKKQG